MPIGTTAAIIIGSLAAGGSAASNIYGARTAGKQNKRALEAGERSDVRADTRERERLAEEQRALDAQIAEKKRAEDAAEEAQFQLSQCGCSGRDGDGDGLACESDCR